MKLDLYEKMEILQNCNLKTIEAMHDSRLYEEFDEDPKDVEEKLTASSQNIIQNVGSVEKNNEDVEIENNLTDLQPLVEQTLEPIMETTTVQLDEQFLAANIQNMINITEDQIVKIQYQSADGVVNTQYIVNQELLNVELDINSTRYLDLNQEIEENLYEEQVPFKILTENSAPVCENSEEMLQDILQESGEVYVTSNDVTIDTNIQSCPETEMRTSMLSPQSEDDGPTETDLTSLNWLHNITNIMAVPNLPTPPVSPKPKRRSQNNSQEDLTININFYKKNGDKKPPFSYATLICMAMGKNGNKMTLSAIYHWIRENFLYYRKAHPSWQVKNTKIYCT